MHVQDAIDHATAGTVLQSRKIAYEELADNSLVVARVLAQESSGKLTGGVCSADWGLLRVITCTQ